MAAEYSRELGVKVADGQRRLVRLGFRVCGTAGFGRRRMMVSPDGRRTIVLETGILRSTIGQGDGDIRLRATIKAALDLQQEGSGCV